MPDLIMVVNTTLVVPVNRSPLLDSTDFKTIEAAVPYNAAGLSLIWHFISSDGQTFSYTSVTPTDFAGDYDWNERGSTGTYAIGIPASGGASINNNATGFGWFTGVATGVLPWCGPVIQFSPANIAKGLVDGTEFLQVDAHAQDFAVSGGSLTTKKPDGSTSTAYSPKTVTSDAGAAPITGAS